MHKRNSISCILDEKVLKRDANHFLQLVSGQGFYIQGRYCRRRRLGRWERRGKNGSHLTNAEKNASGAKEEFIC